MQCMTKVQRFADVSAFAIMCPNEGELWEIILRNSETDLKRHILVSFLIPSYQNIGLYHLTIEISQI